MLFLMYRSTHVHWWWECIAGESRPAKPGHGICPVSSYRSVINFMTWNYCSFLVQCCCVHNVRMLWIHWYLTRIRNTNPYQILPVNADILCLSYAWNGDAENLSEWLSIGCGRYLWCGMFDNGGCAWWGRLPHQQQRRTLHGTICTDSQGPCVSWRCVACNDHWDPRRKVSHLVPCFTCDTLVKCTYLFTYLQICTSINIVLFHQWHSLVFILTTFSLFQYGNHFKKFLTMLD